MKNDKTNVMRILEQKDIEYICHNYPTNLLSGKEIALFLDVDFNRVFKTLVTEGKDHQNYVFVIPVLCELDLKKAASYLDVKFIEMIPQKELLGKTGYIHGGCSPIGMKKEFKTVIDETAILYDKIIFSAGKIGMQVELDPSALTEVLKDISFTDLVKNQ